MGEPGDGFELLRAANPVDVDQVEGPESETAQHMFASIVQQQRSGTSQRGLWGRRLRLAAALAATALVLVAATWLLTRDVENPQAIICHQTVDLDSDIAAAPVGGSATADACVPVWEHSRKLRRNADRSVPPLTACVTERGTLAVFPTDDQTVCETLGLSYPELSSQEAADQIRQLDTDLQAHFASAECAGMEEAEARVRQTLDDSGFDGWSIETQEPSEARPCASYSLDADTETIHLVPIPVPDS